MVNTLHGIINELYRQLAEKDEQIAVLQHQSETWFQDFKQEKKDRQNAESRVSQLDAELRTTKQQLRELNNSHRDSYTQRREETIGRIQREYYQDQCSPVSVKENPFLKPVFPNHGRLVCDFGHENHQSDDEDIIDALLEPTEDVEPVPSSDELVCPKCSSTFKVEDHLLFLAHIDVCTS